VARAGSVVRSGWLWAGVVIGVAFVLPLAWAAGVDPRRLALGGMGAAALMLLRDGFFRPVRQNVEFWVGFGAAALVASLF